MPDELKSSSSTFHFLFLLGGGGREKEREREREKGSDRNGTEKQLGDCCNPGSVAIVDPGLSMSQ